MRVTTCSEGAQGYGHDGSARVGHCAGTIRRSPAQEVANRLRNELARYGIAAGVHVGYGMASGVAVLSVGTDLLVWVQPGPGGCWTYVWWTGQINAVTGRRIYTRCPWSRAASAACRIAVRHRELIEEQSSRSRTAGGGHLRGCLPDALMNAPSAARPGCWLRLLARYEQRHRAAAESGSALTWLADRSCLLDVTGQGLPSHRR